MREYIFGLLTLPVALLALWLLAALASRAVALAVRVGLGAARRYRPGGDSERRRMAGVMYAAERGVLFTRGKAAVLLVWDMDPERADWARTRLVRQVAISEDFKRRMAGDE